MSDDPHRLSPYVRDEETLQRGIEQTALAQTRAAMSSPTAAQVQPIHADMAEKVQGFYLQLLEIGRAGEGIVLTAEHCRELVQLLCAQAQADQQARLRGLMGTWRGHIAWLEDEGDTGERHQAFTECADELDAVLGGKE